ncbi:hypothetical protein MN116_006241 [Schistosoma mekongi]|uniref:L-type lectin-like domain-containing protein n=1 Tax=Schistosoma mekongi TaxID=38744 RepID=A0AAE1ZBM1_SCHME|nr:hypothetical protein MN116_006241 [Schistosoma mekongi]
MVQVALLFLALLKIVCSSYHIRDNSLVPPYLSPYWIPYGSTVTEPQFVRLTSDVKSSHGGIYNTKPLTVRDWEVVITFHVHSSKTLVGDGFAFWYTQNPPSNGPAFGSREKFRGLAVFFDTYANQNGEHSHDHPYISAMINDGSKQYDHDRDGTLTELAGCSSNFRNNDYSVATIRYTNNQLKVSMKYQGTVDPVDCFTVDGVHLPTGYYIGVSAATGDLSDNHDIYSIHTYELDVGRKDNLFTDFSQIEPSADQEAAPRARVDDTPPSKLSHLFTLFSWLFIIGCLGGGGYMGYKYYKKRQRQMKRFY